jgi:hypothetical protein
MSECPKVSEFDVFGRSFMSEMSERPMVSDFRT